MKNHLLLASLLMLLVTGYLFAGPPPPAIDIVDALMVAQYSAGLPVTPPAFADINCDGSFTIADALLIARICAGLPINNVQLQLAVLDPDYPTKLPACSFGTLAALQQEFDVLNDNKLLAELDSYGLVSETIPSGATYTRQPTLMDENAVLLLAWETLIKNQKFTNLNRQTTIDAATISRISTAINTWHIVYPTQIYNGLKVIDTRIDLWVDDHIYTMSGHYYQNIHIPARENVSYTQAGDLVVGTVLTYYDIAGEERVHVVCKQAVVEKEPVKVIVPMKTTDALQLRVCWEVSIHDGLWYIYIDVMTGERIRIEQNFVT